MDKAILTCALTGVLTNPKQHPVPVTPEQMAAEARDAWNAGATVMHVHLRRQEAGPSCSTTKRSGMVNHAKIHGRISQQPDAWTSQYVCHRQFFT